MSAIELLRPTTGLLPSYIFALEAGWLPDNVRKEVAARGQLQAIEVNAEALSSSASVAFMVTFTTVRMLGVGHNLQHLRAAALKENHDQGKSDGRRDRVKHRRIVEGDALAQHLHISVLPVEEHTSPRCQMRSATLPPRRAFIARVAVRTIGCSSAGLRTSC